MVSAFFILIFMYPVHPILANLLDFLDFYVFVSIALGVAFALLNHVC